jgi:APA family basic amino acid/polyamine antiporter
VRKLGLLPGVGLVLSNMIGAGVFLSAGFMAQDMGPGPLLLAWVAGAALALCGATAYAEVARRVPRSGGEYRYLSELLHPALGYLAGWASLLVGFSAPVAVDALAAGAFARALGLGLPPGVVAAAAVVLLTAVHAARLESSRWTQNILAALKVVLMLGFVAVGLAAGHNAWPTWQPPHPTPGFPTGAWMNSLFYVGFAFSGWNAAIYASEEFAHPERDVPRAMQLGCAGVGLLYLIVNWIFVANLRPEQATAVFTYETDRVTLGHVVMRELVGDNGSKLMSAVILLLLLSAMSAMTYTGPRVYAAMAKDGFLPRALAGQPGKPPVGSLMLQGSLALVLIFTHELQEVLGNVGAILTLFAALTALGLWREKLQPRGRPAPPLVSLLAAGVYVLSAAMMLYYGFKSSTHLLLWVGLVAAVALGAYALTRARRGRLEGSRP